MWLMLEKIFCGIDKKFNAFVWKFEVLDMDAEEKSLKMTEDNIWGKIDAI